MPPDHAAAAPAQSRGRSALWWLDGRWATPAWTARPFDRQRQIDPIGHRVHLWAAALWCLCLGAPTSVTELAGIPLLIVFLVRAHRHAATWPRFFVQPTVIVILLWGAWGFLSLVWSPDTTEGIKQLGHLRWAGAALALWPVADRRTLLLGALAAGIAIGQLSQLGHAVGERLGVEWLTWTRLPGRNSGWWDPVVGATILVAALGVHLPAAVWGEGRWRLLGVAGAAWSLLGIVATGTRGAWIAAAGLIILIGAAAGWRAAGRRGLALAVTAVTVLVALAAGAAWTLGGETVRDRVHAARAEIDLALRHGEFDTDTGARIAMAGWAVAILAERPLTGTGAGGYRAWVEGHLRARGADPASRTTHAHAHNAILHTATGGLPALLLALAFIACALRGAWRDLPGDGPRGYARGPFWALLGLLLVSAFDVVHLNAQTGAVLGALTFLALPHRPPPRGGTA